MESAYWVACWHLEWHVLWRWTSLLVQWKKRSTATNGFVIQRGFLADTWSGNCPFHVSNESMVCERCWPLWMRCSRATITCAQARLSSVHVRVWSPKKKKRNSVSRFVFCWPKKTMVWLPFWLPKGKDRHSFRIIWVLSLFLYYINVLTKINENIIHSTKNNMTKKQIFMTLYLT